MTSTYPAAPAVCEIGRLDEVSELARPVAAANERLRHIVEALKAERARAVGDVTAAFGFHDQACLLRAVGPVASGVPC